MLCLWRWVDLLISRWWCCETIQNITVPVNERFPSSVMLETAEIGAESTILELRKKIVWQPRRRQSNSSSPFSMNWIRCLTLDNFCVPRFNAYSAVTLMTFPERFHELKLHHLQLLQFEFIVYDCNSSEINTHGIVVDVTASLSLSKIINISFIIAEERLSALSNPMGDYNDWTNHFRWPRVDATSLIWSIVEKRFHPTPAENKFVFITNHFSH